MTFEAVEETTQPQNSGFEFIEDVEPVNLDSADLLNEFKGNNENVSWKLNEFRKSALRGIASSTSNFGGVVQMIGDNLNVDSISKQIMKFDDAFLPLKFLDVDKVITPTNTVAMEKMGESVSGFGESMGDFYQNISALPELESTGNWATDTFTKNPSWFRAWNGFVGSAPAMVQAYALSIINPYLGITYMGLNAGGETFREADEAGVGTEQATESALIRGVGEGVIEMFSPIKTGGFFKSIQGGITGIAKRVAENSLREGLTEGFQELWANSVAKIGYEPTRQLHEGIVESFAVGTLTGGIFSGGAIENTVAQAKAQGMTDGEINQFIEATSVDLASKDSNNQILQDEIDKSTKTMKELQADPDFQETMFDIGRITREQVERAGATKEEGELLATLFQKPSQIAGKLGLSSKEWFQANKAEIIRAGEFGVIDPIRPEGQREEDEFLDSLRQDLNLAEDEDIPEIYFQFAGKQALTSNKNELAIAQTLDNFGESKESILKKTGWFKGSDGKWRFEVSDKESKLKQTSGKLSDVLEHNNLFEAYPVLKDIKVVYEDFTQYKDDPNFSPKAIGFVETDGSIHINKIVIDKVKIKDIVLHESQHIIQNIEDFEQGGRSRDLAGEIEAKSVVTRKDLSNQERLDKFPTITEDLFQDKKGSFNATDNTIQLLENADKTTLLHEGSHYIANQIQLLNKISQDKFGKNLTEFTAMESWLGKIEDRLTTEQQEKFARGFEQFIRTGEVQNNRIKAIFLELSDFFKKIYELAQDIKYRKNGKLVPVQLSKQATDLYNSLLDSPFISDKQLTPRDLESIEEFSQEDFKEAKIKAIELLERKTIKGKKPILEELKKATKETDVRIAINKASNLARQDIGTPELTPTGTIENIYDNAVELYDSKIKPKDLLKEQGIELGKTKNWWQDKIQPLSTVLKNMSPQIARKLRSAELNTNLRMQSFVKQTEPFVRGSLEIRKQSIEDYARLDLALKNGDLDVILPIMEKYDMVADYEVMNQELDKMKQSLIDAGVPVGDIENYFPRSVKKPKEYLSYLRGTQDWRLLEKELKDKEMTSASENEQAQFINDFLATKSLISPRVPRGVKEETGSDATKARTIATIDANMNLFYEDAIVGMLNSVQKTNNAITLNEFFNTSKEVREETIGEIVREATDAGFFNEQDKEVLIDSLNAYFTGNSASKWVRLIKNVTYLTGLTKITSTLTQIKDLYVSSYRNGIIGTAGAVFSPKEIKAIELGIDKPMAEIQDIITVLSNTDTAMDKAIKLTQTLLDKSLGITGFTKMDMLGKQTFIQANLNKMRNEANKNTDRLRTRLEVMFEESQVSQIIEDLQSKKNTSIVKELLFYNLTDSMPVARTELPTAYLRSDKARLFYTFKSYTIRQFDIIYNDALKKIVAGKTSKERVEGAINLGRIMSLMVLFGVPVDFLKDLLRGQEPDELEDYVLENILQGFGMTRWSLKMAQREGIEKAIMQTLAPATPYLFEIFRDVNKLITRDDFTVAEFRTVNAVPVVGDLYYWWFGGGSD